jgi:hypothetical protein
MIHYNNICKTKSVFQIALLMYYHIWYRGPRRRVIWLTMTLETLLVWWKHFHVIIVCTETIYVQYHNWHSNSIIDVLPYIMSDLYMHDHGFWKQCATIIQSFNNTLSFTIDVRDTNIRNRQISSDRYDFVQIWSWNQLG